MKHLLTIKDNQHNASIEDDLPWKMTSNGRQTQNINSGISQHPLVGFCSNFKPKFM